ncbi:TetR/AcrR family transcriptional regulator [Nocardiopsis gilva YIM 90087]|uniref:TetR/AcrR family transcriptional regulator n=1 Tax=Nocardiopsis gilva YIM 90087 TaxID=1235441 RepID=A0A223S7P2_9ACTN|nr:TetR/AcrR family transcriptional regulator [Nocardiopsis gilva]ASU84126.1 TetR/AcrR family transcriptional regulator [Nocardiopsis gilva YIM 90087]
MRPESSPNPRKPHSIIEEARRRQIVDAAITTVAKVGYAQASLAQIADNARISKSVISYYFDGKDDLLDQIVAEIYADIWAFIEPRLAAESRARDRLRVYIAATLDYMRSHRKRSIAVMTIVGSHRREDGTLRFASLGADDSITGELVAILRQGQRDGEFRDFDPQVLATTVSRALTGALATWVMHPEVDLEQYATELVALFELATHR